MNDKIEVKIIGEPTLESLSESEKVAFYTLLYMKIQELIKEGK